MRANEFLTEKWSQKYKRSINCSHPKGFSQRAHCAGKKKHNESVEQEMTCPDCGMCATHGNMTLSEIKQRLDPKCWKGKHKEGTKIKGGVRVNNCVPNKSINESADEEAWELVGQPVPEIQQFVKQLGFSNDKTSVAKIAPLINATPDTQIPVASISQLKNLANKGNDAQTLKAIQQISGRPDAAEQYARLMQARDAGEGRNRGYPVGDLIQAVKSGNYEAPVLLKLPTGTYVIGGRTRLYAALALGVPAKVKVINANTFAKQGVAKELSEEFDLIESAINNLALRNGVDAEAIWEDLESLTDDELYVFAATSQLNEDWQKVNKKDKTDGMSSKAVKAYRREHPGSKLKTAVTTKPSKLKKGSKASKRRKSYCSRSKGQMKMHNISCAKTPDKAICKARRRWNC